MVLCGCFSNFSADDELAKQVEDSSAQKLSTVGRAAYDALKYKHAWHHKAQWNVTSGKTVGSLHQTPSSAVFKTTADPEDAHADWFPEKMAEIMSKTTTWCDLMSLGPPDGVFLTKIKEALATICANAKNSDKPVIIRMMFGNIVGMPTNCDVVRKALTKDLPADNNIQLWVGAWRKGASWNHAKLIAVDGRYLHTGGHNLWDYHYLKNNPVHDLSIELEGRVAHDGHLFANEQWAYIQRKQAGCVGYCAEKIPDGMPLIWTTRVTISEYPIGKAAEFAPMYAPDVVPRYEIPDGSVPMITMGRQGALTFKNRPADDAMLAMIGASKKIIRMSLQDLGPVCIPKTKISLPGLKWPKPVLNALAKAIYLRGVDVEIVLSNPGSIPGGLGMTEANYGNGWSCVDVASEIVKRIKKMFPGAPDERLRQMVKDNLRICFIRHAKSSTYADGKTIGNHSKYFIVDDIISYTGSQNLYMCDLAEWGVVVDDKTETKKMISDFWNPLWEASYTGDDCDVDAVMDGMDIDRDGEDVNAFTLEGRKKQEETAKMQSSICGGGKKIGMYTSEGQEIEN
mmetsp:Transcript_11134/g.16718  ORF Transcript_11134/g.16718 Transcript_11134/m.16718 type:complete len:568 (-) Transcript_11134:83-1786(-)